MVSDSDEDLHSLVESAIRFISIRPRSISEIRTYLAKKARRMGVADDAIPQSAYVKLVDLGYADDRKFADWWVSARHGNKPKGIKSIEMELRAKGVDEEVAVSALDSADSTETEIDRAKRAVEKKLHIWKNLPRMNQKKKLHDYLMRRGFTSEIIWAVIDEIVPKSYNVRTDD